MIVTSDKIQRLTGLRQSERLLGPGISELACVASLAYQISYHGLVGSVWRKTLILMLTSIPEDIDQSQVSRVAHRQTEPGEGGDLGPGADNRGKPGAGQVVLWHWHEVTLDIEALAEYSDQEVFRAVMLWDDAVRIWPGPSAKKRELC